MVMEGLVMIKPGAQCVLKYLSRIPGPAPSSAGVARHPIFVI